MTVTSRTLPRVCIVGGGPAGMAAGIWAARLGLTPVIVDAGERLGGQLLSLTNEITDYPGIARTSGPELAERFAQHVRAMDVEVRLGLRVTSLRMPRVVLSDSSEIGADAVVLAPGVRRRTLGLPRERGLVGHGVSYSVTRDAAIAADGVGVVVGGGDAALEGAVILSGVCREVHLVHRAGLRARPDFVESLRACDNVRVHADREVVELVGDRSLEEVVLDGGERIRCDGLFVRVGVEPRLGAFAADLPTDPGGYLVTDRRGRCADLVYAVGDICSPGYMSITAAVGQAMTACKHIQLTLRRAGV
jgi:thioredoxin reductase (NADPH)